MHCILFITAHFIIFLIIIFEHSFISFFSKYLNCCQSLQKKFENMQAISNDYYDEIHFKFLVSEYERAKIEKQKYALYMDKIKGDDDFLYK